MISSCDGARHRQRGFTLLEVLVALAIAGLALAVMSEAAAGGIQASKIAAGYQEALSRTRSHLAALVGNEGALVAGQAEGDDGGGYRWRYRVSEIERQGQPAGLALYEVEVAVAWTMGGHRREVVLRTQRVARPSSGARNG